jgi:multidrug resistance efflux pump
MSVPERIINMPGPDPRTARFAIFLELERSARAAENRNELRYIIVNDTRKLVDCRIAALVRVTALGGAQIVSATDVSAPDRQSPFAVFVERRASALMRADRHRTSGTLVRDGLSQQDIAEWDALAPTHMIWTPLKARGTIVGGVLYGRAEPFTPAEIVLLDQIADTYGHADHALRRGFSAFALPATDQTRRRKIKVGMTAALLLIMALPVRQTALAPAEIVAADPLVVASPIEGVLNTFEVTPGERVEAGRVLFRLDDTAARAQRDVAERGLAVSEAELRRATQSAFSDREASAQTDALKAQVELKRADLSYARELLERIAVKANGAGVVVLSDPRRFIGKPVRTGERILEIADPTRVEIRADVPIGQAITLTPGASTTLFLDTQPLSPVSGKLVTAAYEAEGTPSGALAYRTMSTLDNGVTPPRIGLRGTARIDGPRVPLILYLFGRPLAAFRQFIGL